MNEIKLEFELENNVIPSGYNSIMLSFIKGSIKNYDEDIFKKYFENNVMKNYTFSCFFNKPKFNGSQIVLDDKKIRMNFSAYEARDVMLFFNSFMKMKYKKTSLNKNSMVLKNVTAVNIKPINSNKIAISMESPIIARIHNQETNCDNYLEFSDEMFSNTVKTSIQNSIVKNGMNISCDDFKIIPINAKKTVVNHFGIRINANIGTYLLEGNVELLKFLYASGIGSGTNSGHGKFKIIG